MDLSKFIRQRLKIRHLNVLAALDDTLSVSRTAIQLNVTQAAVSRTLSEAEAGFGMPLFERHARGLRRTPGGRETIAAIRQILSDIAALEAIAGLHQDVTSGEINIGFQTVTAQEQMVALIRRFKQHNPHVRVLLRDGILADLLDDLRHGRLDLVFGRLGPDIAGKGLEAREMCQADIHIASSNPALLESESLDELLNHPWVLPLPGTPMRIEFDRLCGQARCDGPSDLIETNTPYLMVEFMRESGRLGMVPVSIAASWRQLANLYSRPFPGRFTSEPIGLICVADKRHRPAVARFLEFHGEVGMLIASDNAFATETLDVSQER